MLMVVITSSKAFFFALAFDAQQMAAAVMLEDPPSREACMATDRTELTSSMTSPAMASVMLLVQTILEEFHPNSQRAWLK